MVTRGALLGRNDALALPDVLHSGYNVAAVLQTLRHRGVRAPKPGSVIGTLSKVEHLLREFQRVFDLSYSHLVPLPKARQRVKKRDVLLDFVRQFPRP